MRSLLKYVTAACGAAMLLACADAVQRGSQTQLSAVAMADDAYAIARSQHLAGRHDDAVISYQAALGAIPAHVAARNGLAALKAEQGDLAGAIALWRTLATAEAEKEGPGKAYLFANLGYAYFLQGEHKAALAALEKACLLDPLSYRAWERLAGVLEKMGQRGRAARRARLAATLRAHDLGADYGAGARSEVAAIDFAVRSGETDDDGHWDSTDIRPDAQGVFVLSRIKAARARQAAPFELAAGAITVGPDGMVSLEIRNGNGITGAARALAGRMGEPGLRVVRLSNHKGYGVLHTRVEYRPAHRAAAERLAARIGTRRVQAAPSSARADLRLVIGRDLKPALPRAVALRAREAAPAS